MQPLDRKFALTLGHLIQAAYKMWDTAQGLPYPRSLTRHPQIQCPKDTRCKPGCRWPILHLEAKRSAFTDLSLSTKMAVVRLSFAEQKG